MAAKKPDCTGQRFGRLTVLGEGEIYKDDRGKTRRAWHLRCDCGSEIAIPRGYFDRPKRGQRSCGCLARNRRELVQHNRHPMDIAGQRFGSLTAIELTGKHDKSGKPTWLLKCDCGGTAEMSKGRINQGYALHCGDPCHHQKWLRYPPTPSPYPVKAGELVVKYFHLLTLPSNQIKSEVEDEQRDRLIRASWIITYRRSQGEVITELHEKRFIQKYIRMAAIAVKQQNYIDQNGGYVVRSDGKVLKAKIKGQRLIGGEMTDATFLDYPVSESETPEINILSNQPKRFCFKRR